MIYNFHEVHLSILKITDTTRTSKTTYNNLSLFSQVSSDEIKKRLQQ